MRKNYVVKEDYFEKWSHDMAYVLGFIVADGNIHDHGYAVQIDVSPKDIAVLEFIRDQITPDYVIKTSGRGTEVRWYPSSSVLKQSLMKHGVIPRKTGKERVPPSLPSKYFWDFVRGYFDGDGSVGVSVAITCNSKSFLDVLCQTTNLGNVRPDRMNHRWLLESKSDIATFFKNVYSTGSFYFHRKWERMQYLVTTPAISGRFSREEDVFLTKNYDKETRYSLAVKLGRSPMSIKNRLRKLNVRKEGASFAA